MSGALCGTKLSSGGRDAAVHWSSDLRSAEKIKDHKGLLDSL